MDLSAYQIKESVELRDDEWDRFVEFDANGQFEQTSRWGQVKHDVGWRPLRILVLQNEKIVAGAQILVHGLLLFGKAGYIPKGPLILGDEATLLPLIINLIKETSKRHRIRFLFVQTPNDYYDVDRFLLKEGFIRDHLFRVISATTRIDLTQNFDTLLSKMTRNYRYNIRFAERNDVIVREGGREDIPLFFQMMLETCKRQGVRPNPSRESLIQKLWSLFYPKGNVRLFLAEYKGQIVSALIGIPFGKTFYAWKMGWSGAYEKSRANHLLHWEAIKWAKNKGFHLYDFMAVSRKVAEAVVEGTHFYKVAKSADLFKLSFGGDVILLPETQIYIKNPFIQLFYNKGIPGLLRLYRRTQRYPFFSRIAAKAGVAGF